MQKKETWFALGDINAFFGLSLDNIAGLVLIVGILSGPFGVPADFCLRYMVPGTAIGVLVGDLLYFGMAIWLARKTQTWSVTSMPLGLDTPSIFGMGFFVLGPSFLKAKNELGMNVDDASIYMWEIGIGCVFFSGVFKVLCSFGSSWARNGLPRAGLLGSLAAIALVIISFLPLLDILASPIVGFTALAIVLTALIGQVKLPGRIPGVVGALIVAGSMHYLLKALGYIHSDSGGLADPTAGLLPQEWRMALDMHWFQRLGEAAAFLPIVLPLALATVIGGIDCTESAAAVGDHFPTGSVIGVEAFATLAAAFCGGVIQTTPYIGHPAYKSMGGRAAYTLATAIFIGAAGIIGFFGYFYQYVPAPAVYPILIFVGLEISSQSFLATNKRHYPAVALACVPALAFLSMNFVGQIFGDSALNVNPSNLSNSKLREQIEIAGLLANGFIVTSLLWASSLAMGIDRRLYASGGFMLFGALFTLFGIIHSPLPGAALYVPISFPGIPSHWVLPAEKQELIYTWAAAYAVAAATLFAWGYYLKTIGEYGPAEEIDGEGI